MPESVGSTKGTGMGIGKGGNTGVKGVKWGTSAAEWLNSVTKACIKGMVNSGRHMGMQSMVTSSFTGTLVRTFEKNLRFEVNLD